MGKVISSIGRGVGKLLGIDMSTPSLPPVPPPPPITPRMPVEAEGSERERLKEKVRRRRGRGGTMKTGPRGVTTGESISYQSLLGGNSRKSK